MKSKLLISKLILVASFGFMISCGSSANTNQESQDILSAYLKVKDALVRTASKTAKSEAKNLVTAIGNTDDELAMKIKASARDIEASEDIGEQRKHFNDLSENMYVFVKGLSITDKPVYRQFCPMAFNNTGAYWLAAEKEINNPYFGDKMLHCGSVKEEL